MDLAPGLRATAVLTVGAADLAPALHSGEIPVLATPRLVALCEEATMAAVATHLAPGDTTVGSRVQFDHLAPSLPGARVTATAHLDEVTGRRLTFTVSAREGSRPVGRGRIERVVVNGPRFLERAGA